MPCALAAADRELAIATSMRRGEFLALDWQHVHLEERYMHLPETKNGESMNVPLSTQAVAILAVLKGDDEPEGRVFDVSANASSRPGRAP